MSRRVHVQLDVPPFLLFLPVLPVDPVYLRDVHWVFHAASFPLRLGLDDVDLLSSLFLSTVPRCRRPFLDRTGPLLSHLRARLMGTRGSVVDILPLVQVVHRACPLLLD